MKNALGIEMPDWIPGYGPVKPYGGVEARQGEPAARASSRIHRRGRRGQAKLLDSFGTLFEAIGLKDGMTVSFHHHLRNGDKVTNLVMQKMADYGVKDIHLAATGLFPCHEPLVALMKTGVITQISASALGYGAVTEAVSKGFLEKPAILYTHGGRARAVESGDLPIHVVFVAAPSCDAQGNMNGSRGPNACGCLAYHYADVQHADWVVAVTDNLVDYPCCPIEIAEDCVDYVIQIDSIGDPRGIASGAMAITTDPDRLEIAALTADFIDALGLIRDGMSFQTGAGGISLAVAAKVRDKMLEKGVVGSFGSGGIHGYFVKMLEEGLLRTLLDVQCFDIESIENIKADPRHMIMSASQYANPENKGCVVNHLDVMILGAFEADVAFNLNVNTGSDGIIRAASGGNADTAAGSRLSIVVSELMKKNGRCFIRDHVTTITTPGETVDAIVTDRGIAVNPLRRDIVDRLKDSGLPIVDIQTLRQIGRSLGAADEQARCGDRIVGVVEYRDGTVIDLIRVVLDA